MLPDSTAISVLSQSVGGLLSSGVSVAAPPGEPAISTRIVTSGALHYRDRNTEGPDDLRRPAAVSGTGSAVDGAEALLLALAEGLERYCAGTYSEQQYVWTSPNRHALRTLDLNRIPRCSRSELADPLCPVSAPDPDLPIRWVRGISLGDGGTTLIPAIMTYLNIVPACPAERIWLPISTGCSAHRSYEHALLSGMLEVIERDALAVAWIGKIPLPRIEVDCIPDSLAPCWERYLRSSGNLEYFFFDATTDLGIPTVYGIQISHGESAARTLVSCATALDGATAMAKVMRDMQTLRIAFRPPPPCPANVNDFQGLFDGAAYMARAEHAHAFDFLLRSPRRTLLSDMQCPWMEAGHQTPKGLHTGEREALRAVARRLDLMGLETYVVDITLDDAIRAGMRVVRVLIPGLQPLSFHHRARFLGHPRIYEAPAKMGYPVRTEGELNPWPQPFA